MTTERSAHTPKERATGDELVTSPVLIRRVNAAQATLNQFNGQPFRMGVRDCVRMTAAHLRRLGHKVKLPPTGSYRSRKTALKQLADRGYESVAAAIDAMGFERIAPAAALVGDIVQLPSVDELGGLAVVLTNGRIVGYHEDALASGALAMHPSDIAIAWRVPV